MPNPDPRSSMQNVNPGLRSTANIKGSCKKKRDTQEPSERARLRSINNRAAAQDSRDRQKTYVKDLEQRNRLLTLSNNALQSSLEEVKAQNRLLLARLQIVERDVDTGHVNSNLALSPLFQTCNQSLIDQPSFPDLHIGLKNLDPSNENSLNLKKTFNNLFSESNQTPLTMKSLELFSDPTAVVSMQQINSENFSVLAMIVTPAKLLASRSQPF